MTIKNELQAEGQQEQLEQRQQRQNDTPTLIDRGVFQAMANLITAIQQLKGLGLTKDTVLQTVNDQWNA